MICDVFNPLPRIRGFYVGNDKDKSTRFVEVGPGQTLIGVEVDDHVAEYLMRLKDDLRLTPRREGDHRHQQHPARKGT